MLQADTELQRPITLKELAPNPYFSIINVYLADINVESSIIAFKILINQNVADGQTDGGTDNVETQYTPHPQTQGV